MTHLEIQWNRDGSAVLSGEFDLAAIEDAEQKLSLMTQTAPRSYDVDIRNVGFIDSAGLLALLNLWKRLGSLRILVKENSQPSRILAVSGYDKGAFDVKRMVE